MAKKLTYEQVYKGFQEKGWLLKSPSYDGSQVLLTVVCDAGHDTTITWNNFQRGQGCRHCAGNIKLDIEVVRAEFSKKGFELLDTSYVNNHSKLLYRCSCGKTARITLNDVKRSYSCASCKSEKISQALRHDDSVFVAGCQERGCRFISRAEMPGHTRIRYRCHCGRESEANWDNFKRHPGCWECSKAKKSGALCYRWNPDRKQVERRKRYAKICNRILRRCLKSTGAFKAGRTAELLGYDGEELLSRLRSFPEYNESIDFHIDHIFPVKAFLDYGITDLKIINRLDNLRPMAVIDNLSKGAKYSRAEFEKWLAANGIECSTFLSDFAASGAADYGVVLYDVFQAEESVEQVVSRCRDGHRFVTFPHEWVERSAQILAHVKSYTLSLPTMPARKCTVSRIDLDTLREFCDRYHIQGSNRLGKAGWGIYDGNQELLGVLSLGRHNRQSSQEEIVLDRLCFREGVRVVGGASKLFSAAKTWAEKKRYSRVVSFSDNRLTTGTVYERMGFVLEKNLPPDYFYLEQGDVTKWHSKQSEKKTNTNCPDDKTELEWATERGLFRVYDAGKKRWVFTIVPSAASKRRPKSGAEKRASDREKSKRHYDKKIATNKVEVSCAFCEQTHLVLAKSYENNVARNGRYICEREGGHIAGSKPKLALRKDNPHAAEGKKECVLCKDVKRFDQFGTDKSRRDGFSSRCAECRAKVAKEKYQSGR